MTAVTHPLARRPAPPFGSWSPSLVEPGGRLRRPRPARPAAISARPSRARFRRRRAIAALTAALTAAVLLGAGAALVVPGEGSLASPGAPAASLVPVARTTYLVQPGDTLWQIARALQPSGDVRPLVQRLAAAHGGAPLRAGERLALPGGPGAAGHPSTPLP